MQFVYLAIAIVAEVAATTALKASAGFKVPLPSAIVVVGYAVSFYFLSLLVLISLAAWWLYGQTLDAAALAGMALIAAGVAVINLFSQSVNH
jgi:small multidrug resistance pump